MASLFYALEIITDDGTGTPETTSVDATIGLHDDGHFYLVEGAGLSGTASGHANSTWYEGVLSEDWHGENPSYEADISAFGGVMVDTSFSFKISNWTRWLYTVQTTLGINLMRRRVILYGVTGVNDPVFTQIIQGRIDSIPESETDSEIKVITDGVPLFSEMIFPDKKVDRSTFTNVSDDVIDKPIPVCFGRVKNANLLQVKREGDPIQVAEVSAVAYYAAPCGSDDRNINNIGLKVGDLSVSANQWQGKYLKTVRGTVDQAYYILSNAASSGGGVSITLSGWWTNGNGGKINLESWSSSGMSFEAAYFEIVDIAHPRILSDSPVYSIGQVRTFDKDLDRYVNWNIAGQTSSTTNIDSTGYPGVNAIARTFDDGRGLLNSKGVYSPASAIVQEKTITYGGAGWTTNTDTVPAETASAPNVIDGSHSTEYEIEFDNFTASPSGTASVTVTFDLTFEDLGYISGIKGISMCSDLVLSIVSTGTASLEYGIRQRMYGVDAFGGVTVSIGNAGNVLVGSYTSEVINDTLEIDNIPWEFYDDDSLGADHANNVANYDITKIINDQKDLDVFSTIRVQIDLDIVGATGDIEFGLKFKECALVVQRDVNIVTENLYVETRGVIFGDTWGGRRTAADPVYNVIDAIEWILRFIGVSGSEIDTATFDAVKADRSSYDIGFQHIEEKTVREILDELCRHAWVILFQNQAGAWTLGSWLEASAITNVYTLNNTLEDSFTFVENTPQDKAYNEFNARYAWSPGHKSHQLVLGITKVNESAFPAEGTLISGTAIPLWKTYAPGWTDYDDAEAAWDVLHAAYTVGLSRNPCPEKEMDLRLFVDKDDWSDYSGDVVNNWLSFFFIWVPGTKPVYKLRIAANATTWVNPLLEWVYIIHPIFSPSSQLGIVSRIEYLLKEKQIEVTIVQRELS